MFFMVVFAFRPDQRQAAIDRFLETGAPPGSAAVVAAALPP
ncbi:MAG: hypothetical protein ACYS0G_05835 [Planctomycetota bacterium]|jgi:hypothetical protein